MRRVGLYRGDRPVTPITGRSVIVTDDGIATGSNMMAVLQAVKTHDPCEVIVAVPVAGEEAIEQIRRHCDQAVWVITPRFFWSISDFYEDFPAVEDAEVVELMRLSARTESVGQSSEVAA